MGFAEDAVYALIAVMLVASSLYALALAGGVLIAGAFTPNSGIQPVLTALDQTLIVLIFIELFYTIRLSLREHSLAVEPFIAVALIASVRRILVLTAEERQVVEDAAVFQRVLLELGVLAGLVLVLVFAMVLLSRVRLNPQVSKE
jgi:uncharacterized membrane protein (DUF373 family)